MDERDWESTETACPRCGNDETRVRPCMALGCYEGGIDEVEDDPINGRPGRFLACDDCYGTGHNHWCPHCGLDLNSPNQWLQDWTRFKDLLHECLDRGEGLSLETRGEGWEWMPQRIQLRRKQGWRMPENTVKVDRSTPWGNPFITGKHGSREECVKNFIFLASGLVCLSDGNATKQSEFLDHLKAHREDLRGKNLACWCPIGKPCHADWLLLAVNTPKTLEGNEK